MNKSLKEKAVDIKGKPYVPVHERIIFFNNTYENGSIRTEMLSEVGAASICIKATVTPDTGNPERIFTGYSQETVGDGFINKTSALENAETSAVGRALAMMGIGVIESIASSDEIHKAEGGAETGEQAEKPWSSWEKKEKQPPTYFNGKVAKCGHPSATSKTGNEYCSIFCWLPQEERAKKGLEPITKEEDPNEFNFIDEGLSY